MRAFAGNDPAAPGKGHLDDSPGRYIEASVESLEQADPDIPNEAALHTHARLTDLEVLWKILEFQYLLFPSAD
jgi:hypothetical protein